MRPKSSFRGFENYSYNTGFFCIILCQVDFSSRLKVTCSNTDGAKKSRRWRFNRPTWPDLKDPCRPKSTDSTRLSRLSLSHCLIRHALGVVQHHSGFGLDLGLVILAWSRSGLGLGLMIWFCSCLHHCSE